MAEIDILGATARSYRSGSPQAARRPRQKNGDKTVVVRPSSDSLYRELPAITLANGRVLRLQVTGDLETARDDWQVLQSSGFATPFQQFSWIDAWHKTVGKKKNCRPLVVVASDENGVQLILPLAIESRFGGTLLTWLAHELSDYCAPLINHTLLAELTVFDAAELLKIAGREARSLGAIYAYLSKQPATLNSCANPFVVNHSFEHSSSAHSAFIDGSWSEYIQRRRGKSTRRRIAQKSKRLDGKGKVDFVRVTDHDGRLSAIKRTLQWKHEQLSQRATTDHLLDSSVDSFFAELVSRSDTFDLLCVYELRLDDQAIASAFGFVDETTYLLYQTAYASDEHSECSPGLLLLTKMMEDCADRGLQVFDFSLGDEPYKFQWSDDHQQILTSCFALTLTGTPMALALRLGAQLKRFIKTNATAMRAIDALYRLYKLVPSRTAGAGG